MRLQQGLVWTTATLALTLVLSGSRSTSEAQEKPAKSSMTQDDRYDVYVSGIT